MKYIVSFPALAIVVGAYLLMAAGGDMMIDGDAYSRVLPSGVEMTLRGGDFFVIAGLVALFLEMLKAAWPSRAVVADNVLSTATFGWALACFLMIDYAGTATFLIITLMTLIDVVAGFIIAAYSARRDR